MMTESQQSQTPPRDEFCAKAVEFRRLEQRTKDSTIAEAYRKLAEGYETLARHNYACDARQRSVGVTAWDRTLSFLRLEAFTA
jgi:hypothetical protein